MRGWVVKLRPIDAELAEVARRLASDTDMAGVWEELGSKQVGAVFDAVCGAKVRAEDEVRRPAQTAERIGLARVTRAARALKVALEASPLPQTGIPLGHWRPGEGVRAGGKIWLFLRGEGNRGSELAPIVSMPELLDALCDLVERKEKALPPRAVQRATKDPLPPAFLRWLNLLLIENGVPLSPRVLATIMNAVRQEFEDAWTGEEVKAVLRDQPEAFRVPKKSGRSP